MITDKEINQVADDEKQKDWNDLKYADIYKDGFIDGAKWMQMRAGQVKPEVILPKPNPQVFTLADLEKAYNDGYKNGIMNEAGLECEPFSVWYNWVHIIKSKNRSEA